MATAHMTDWSHGRDPQYLTIEGKPLGMGGVATLADFSISQGDPVDAAIVCASPNISLYCLDDAAQRVIFVELPHDVDLTKAPYNQEGDTLP